MFEDRNSPLIAERLAAVDGNGDRVIDREEMRTLSQSLIESTYDEELPEEWQLGHSIHGLDTAGAHVAMYFVGRALGYRFSDQAEIAAWKESYWNAGMPQLEKLGNYLRWEEIRNLYDQELQISRLSGQEGAVNATFVFDHHGQLISDLPSKDEAASASPSAAIKKSDGSIVSIRLQDPSSDVLRYSGNLRESLSDWDNRPAVSSVIVVTPEHVSSLLESEFETSVASGRDFLDVQRTSVEAQDGRFLETIFDPQNFPDWAHDNPSMDDKLYVLEVDGEYVGFNAQNFGNLLYGASFQQAGVSLGLIQALAHGYCQMKFGSLDSADDQEAIAIGWQLADAWSQQGQLPAAVEGRDEDEEVFWLALSQLPNIVEWLKGKEESASGISRGKRRRMRKKQLNDMLSSLDDADRQTVRGLIFLAKTGVLNRQTAKAMKGPILRVLASRGGIKGLLEMFGLNPEGQTYEDSEVSSNSL